MKQLRNRIKKVREKLNLRRTLKLIWSIAPGWTVLSACFIVLETFFWFGTLYTLKLMVDTLANPKLSGDAQLEQMMLYITLAGVVSIFYACIKSFSSYLTELQGVKINHAIDEKLHKHTLDLDLTYYETPEHLDILKRAREAGAGRPYAVVVSLSEVIKNLFMMAAVGSILITIDWMLLPILALFVLPMLLIRVKFSEKLYNWQRSQTSLERKASYLSTVMTGDSSAKEIRAFSLGDYLRFQYSGIRKKLLSQQLSLSKKRTLIEMLTTIMVTSAFFAITAYIVFGTLKGKTSVGDIAVFLVIFPQTFGIMQALAGSISNLYQNNIYVANIFEFFNLKQSLYRSENPMDITDNESSEFTIEHVSFKYDHATEPTLVDVNMKIPSGKIIALVGLNGAGKSTLIKLLCRLYDPTSGKISMGGNDIREYDIREYRKQISTVFQDFVRYNVSVSDNIRYGDIDGEFRKQDMIEASKNAGAHSFISEFPDGYDTMMGRAFDDGHEVSIGQWQKLAIARSFYSPSRLIIFDEATSALDARSESDLFHSFRQRIGNRSALVISHRLSTVKHADFIYVMGDKKIVEQGTHEELVQRENGVYARLFQTHSENEITESAI